MRDGAAGPTAHPIAAHATATNIPTVRAHMTCLPQLGSRVPVETTYTTRLGLRTTSAVRFSMVTADESPPAERHFPVSGCKATTSHPPRMPTLPSPARTTPTPSRIGVRSRHRSMRPIAAQGRDAHQPQDRRRLVDAAFRVARVGRVDSMSMREVTVLATIPVFGMWRKPERRPHSPSRHHGTALTRRLLPTVLSRIVRCPRETLESRGHV